MNEHELLQAILAWHLDSHSNLPQVEDSRMQKLQQQLNDIWIRGLLDRAARLEISDNLLPAERLDMNLAIRLAKSSDTAQFPQIGLILARVSSSLQQRL